MKDISLYAFLQYCPCPVTFPPSLNISQKKIHLSSPSLYVISAKNQPILSVIQFRTISLHRHAAYVYVRGINKKNHKSNAQTKKALRKVTMG